MHPGQKKPANNFLDDQDTHHMVDDDSDCCELENGAEEKEDFSTWMDQQAELQMDDAWGY